MPTYFTSTEFAAPLRVGFETASQHELSVADFNGDGKLDVALSYFLYPLENRAVPIRVLLGDGAGGFSDQTAALFPNGAPVTVHAREHAVGDFNRDGRPDLFIADHGYDAPPFPGSLNAMFLSTGANGLVNAAARLPTTVDYSHSVEAADIDRDGDLDLLVGNSGGPVASYFLINDGAGNFTQDTTRLPSVIANANSPSRIVFTTEAFLDADGDGDLDVFLGAARQNGVHMLLLNDGAGRFVEAASRPGVPAAFVTGSDAVDAHALDLNGDGRLDLLVAFSIGADNPQRYVQVLISRGDGTFVDETTLRLPAAIQQGDWSRRLIVEDFNRDGHPDILLSNYSTAPLFLNDGTGKFVQMPAGFIAGNQYDQFSAGDLNGDGRIDLFAARGHWDGQERFRVDLTQDPGTNQAGTAAAEGFMGDNDAETINAGAGNDVIVGGGGDDYLRGDDGDDRIVGGDGFDDTHGNMGNDTVSGGRGPDWVVGGKDNDLLFGEDGDDIVYGNLGDDTCEGGDGADIVRGGQGSDIVRGGAGDDWLAGDRGDDTLTGGGGADIFHTHGDAGLDRVLDFSRAEGDRVYLLPGTQYTLAQEGADVAINMVGGGKMVLVGVQLASLTGDWIFGA